jgi:hypothetical protein
MLPMETFIVRLWTPGDSEELRSGSEPVKLRGVVDGGRLQRSRTFDGAQQFLVQLEAALTERLQSKADTRTVIDTSPLGSEGAEQE